MIQSLRNIKLRIRSIENIEKITHAMEIVSAVKFNRIKNRLLKSRLYFTKLETMLCRLLNSAENISNPLLSNHAQTGKITLCVISSDAGLCSVYNHIILTQAEKFITTRGSENVSLITVGRESYNYFSKHGFIISESYLDSRGSYSQDLALKILNALKKPYLSGSCDEVYTAHMHFSGTLKHTPVIQKFLSVECRKIPGIEYIIEPDIESVLSQMLESYIYEKVCLMLLDAFTSEHSMRMVAMKTATDNADELIDTLTLLRNKARQAAITKEVLEIASASEALKG